MRLSVYYWFYGSVIVFFGQVFKLVPSNANIQEWKHAHASDVEEFWFCWEKIQGQFGLSLLSNFLPSVSALFLYCQTFLHDIMLTVLCKNLIMLPVRFNKMWNIYSCICVLCIVREDEWDSNEKKKTNSQ